MLQPEVRALSYAVLVRRHGAILAFGVLHAASSGFGQTFFVSLFQPALMGAHGLDRSSFGGLYGLATLASSLLLPWAGRGIDVWPERRYSAAVLLGLASACLAVAGAFNPLTLFLALLLLRLCGQGLSGHVASTTVARHFERSRGSALSLSALGFPASEMCLPLLATLAIGAFGYRATFVACAVIVCLLVLPLSQWLYALRGPCEQAAPAVGGPRRTRGDWTRAEVLRAKGTWALLPLLNAHPLLLTGLFLHQLSLSEAKGWSPTVMATSFVAFGISRATASFLVGPLIDRYGPHRILATCLVPLMGGLCGLGLSSAPWVAAVYLTGAGLSTGASGAARTAFMAQTFGLLHLGAIRSMFSMLGVLSSAIAPPLFGLWLDAGGSVVGLIAACLGYTLLAFVLGLLGLRSLLRSE
ncbi:MAG: MFS transporter [Myxococcales bacterium]|nr:MFS transporter [Myxococcales bacterium]